MRYLRRLLYLIVEGDNDPEARKEAVRAGFWLATLLLAVFTSILLVDRW